jgi:hypothetical protein
MRLRLRSVVPEAVSQREAIRREKRSDIVFAAAIVGWVAIQIWAPVNAFWALLSLALALAGVSGAVRAAYWHGYHQSTAARNRWERRGYLE